MKSLASKLNKRINILRPPGSDDVDEIGQPLDTWLPIAQTWASIEPLSGRELFSAMQINAEVTTKIIIRYRTDINRTMKAIYNGTEFEFLYVIHKDYAKKELYIMCKERQ